MQYRLDYFYGEESEQFAFYRIPKVLFKDSRFKEISAEAKVLYGLMLDRMSLSLKNKWFDNENRVYIIYTISDIMEDLNCADQKAGKLLAELDCVKGVGLIERKRQGLGKPNIIYVKNFSSGTVMQKSENHDSGKVNITNQEKLYSQIKISDNQHSRTVINGSQEQRNSLSNDNNISNTEFNNIYPIYPEILISEEDGQVPLNVVDELDKRKSYRQLICENIDFDLLVSIYSMETVCGIVDIMLDAVCHAGDFQQINGTPVPQSVVKSQLLKLNHTHIGYVLECLSNNTTKVKNIRSYILTALYNSLSTLEHYYIAEVNHDLYGKPERS